MDQLANLVGRVLRHARPLSSSTAHVGFPSDRNPHVRRFHAGDQIAWRNRVRIDRTGTRHPSFAAAMRVVQDDDDLLALFGGPGYPMKRRNADLAHVPAFRHQPVLGWRRGWSDEIWGPRRVLVLKEPRAEPRSRCSGMTQPML